MRNNSSSIFREANMKKYTLLALTFALFLGSASAIGFQQDASNGQNTPPDNSKVNQRDKAHTESTADQQTENESDREMARKIRQAIVKDKSLSTYAHNVKVIVQNGAVTLKGPVRSPEEKEAIEAKATQVVGTGRVTDQIEVAPK
jgi:osmotically-inducible protein OsmY